MAFLSLCMIVKNEEKFLEQCLCSLQALVDEIIIVDTGSTDKTKDIARKFTQKVFDFAWCDDFSAARNESLKYATGDWILVLDADETIAVKDHQALRTLLTFSPAVQGYILIQRNYIKDQQDLNILTAPGFQVKGRNEAGNMLSSNQDSYAESGGTAGWLPTPIVRLFRRAGGVAFSGVVHEDVSPSLTGAILNSSIPIHHVGKLNTESWKKKWALYQRLGKLKVQQEKDYFAYYELGRQYLAQGLQTEAKEMFLQSIALNGTFWLSWYNVGSLQLIQQFYDAAIQSLERARQLNSQVPIIYSSLGVAYAKKKEFSKAIDVFTAGLRIDPQNGEILRNMGRCYRENGDLARAELAFMQAKELESQ